MDRRYGDDDPRFIPDWRKGKGSTAQVKFGVPSSEDTRLWGDKQAINLKVALVGDAASAKSDQLVYIERKRPTCYDAMVLLDLGPNWTGETTALLEVDFVIGLGKTTSTLRRIYTLTATQLKDNAQAVQDLFQFPAAVVSCAAQFLLTGANHTGDHNAAVTVQCAPVFE